MNPMQGEDFGGVDPVEFEKDFFSDEPLPACPLRNEGDDICESCQ